MGQDSCRGRIRQGLPPIASTCCDTNPLRSSLMPRSSSRCSSLLHTHPINRPRLHRDHCSSVYRAKQYILHLCSSILSSNDSTVS